MAGGGGRRGASRGAGEEGLEEELEGMRGSGGELEADRQGW